MARNETTSMVIDELLRLSLDGVLIGTMLLAPNALLGLSKPLDVALSKLDERQKERELRRIVGYMERGKLLAKNYQHGLEITAAGKRRLKRRDFETLAVSKPEVWDGRWRVVIFDIPEEKRQGRVQLTGKLRELGFQPLQQSAWIHPHPCREEITAVTEHYDLSKYVTYLETTRIDHSELLIKRFASILKDL